MKCIGEVFVEDDIRIRLAQYCFQSLKLGLEARGIIRRIFPVQSKLDAGLDYLRRDANDANDAERISHLISWAEKIQSIGLKETSKEEEKVEMLKFG